MAGKKLEEFKMRVLFEIRRRRMILGATWTSLSIPVKVFIVLAALVLTYCSLSKTPEEKLEAIMEDMKPTLCEYKEVETLYKKKLALSQMVENPEVLGFGDFMAQMQHVDPNTDINELKSRLKLLEEDVDYYDHVIDAFIVEYSHLDEEERNRRFKPIIKRIKNNPCAQ